MFVTLEARILSKDPLMTQDTAPGRAALSILAGMATLGLSDNFVPYVSHDSSLWQFHLLRGRWRYVPWRLSRLWVLV